MSNNHIKTPVEEDEGKLSHDKVESEFTGEANGKNNLDSNLEVINVSLPEEICKPQAEPTTSSSTENFEITPEGNIKFSVSIPGQDKITCTYKRNQKTNKRSELSETFPLLTKLVVKSFLSQNSIRDSENNRKLYEIYPNPDKLCDDCRWLVKATESSESMKSSSEDEEFVTQWIESRKSIKTSKENTFSGENSGELITKECGKDNVVDLLNEVHSSLLECNILLTTQKLQKKFRKSANGKDDTVISEMSLSDDLFDQIQAEEDNKDGTSKLCLVLERLVSKYLKCSER